MIDERISYEPVTENGEHYVIVSMKFAKISTQKADGKTRSEAAEAGLSMLIDLCDHLFDESQSLITELRAAREVVEAAKLQIMWCGEVCPEWPAMQHADCQGSCGNRLICAALSRYEAVS